MFDEDGFDPSGGHDDDAFHDATIAREDDRLLIVDVLRGIVDEVVVLDEDRRRCEEARAREAAAKRAAREVRPILLNGADHSSSREFHFFIWRIIPTGGDCMHRHPPSSLFS